MIDFTLTENDEARLARIYAEGEFTRQFVRDADENESELPPETLPGAEEFLATLERPPAPGPDDTQGPAMMTLYAIAQNWGDYSLRPKRAGGGALQRGAVRRGHRGAEGEVGRLAALDGDHRARLWLGSVSRRNHSGARRGDQRVGPQR